MGRTVFSFIEPTRFTSSCIESEDEAGMEPSPPKLKNLVEAVRNLEDVQEFLDSKGYISEATAIGGTLLFRVSHKITLEQFISKSAD